MTYKKIYMTFNIKRHMHARVIFRCRAIAPLGPMKGEQEHRGTRQTNSEGLCRLGGESDRIQTHAECVKGGSASSER